MKRTNLTTAVIAGIAGIAGISNMANAVYLNGDGLGQVLVYPYYTVNAGNSTVVTVINTTNTGKAVKVRFLEGYNSREVLDFNLYMSGYDVWTAQVVPSGTGAGVFTTDNSCTVPALPRSSTTAFPFSTFGFDGTSIPADGGPVTASRTTEGYLEMIEMGTVTNVNDNSLTALTHKDGLPANCAQLVNAWTPNSANPYWLQDNSNDIAAATGGLFGSGTIVNVGAGTVEGYNAEAIDRFWATPPTPGATFEHTDPSNLAPAIGNATSLTSYVFAQATAGAGGQLITTNYSNGADAVTSLFMADTIYNEYWTGGGIGLNSEWVVTFPTKRYYVDKQLYAQTGVKKPFDVVFDKTVGNNGLAGSSCSPIGVNYYDREERTPGVQIGQICPSPLVCGPVATTTTLCYEANVVTFNQTATPSAVLGSSLVTSITTGFNNGWASIDLVDIAETAQHVLPSAVDAENNAFLGLPGTGFWVAEFQNGNVLPGVLSNYTSLYKHKLHRSCNAGEAACS
jgi:hypothetical protein